MKNSRLILALSAVILIAACAQKAVHIDNGQYWQRVSVSDMIYQQGPKAQQMLNRDISHCVVELRELERLGMVRGKDAIPEDSSGRILNPDEKELYGYDTPERDHYLFAEHGDYQDFESCMLAKGWERVKHVPYDVADRAEKAFYATHLDYKDRIQVDGSTKTITSSDQGDFGNLND